MKPTDDPFADDEPLDPREPREPDDDGPYRVFGRGTRAREAQPPPPAEPEPPAAPPTPYWAVAAHLAPLAAFLLPGRAVGLLIPLFIWQIVGRDDELVEDQAKEALNFQINLAVLYVVLWLSCVGALLVPVLIGAQVVFSILAAIQAAEGRRYRYPWIRRLVR